ncbi:hypothetical protein KKH27_12900 [bacterium]|nr:hypothetical protein [bacterium]MBU1983644.1 hypothetical protein [bacterium]
MKSHVLLILIAAVLMIVLGCDDENGPPTPSPSMELLDVPTALPSNVDVFHTYSVRVTGAVPDSILCEVTRPDGTPLESFSLYDDGSWRTFDSPSYASFTSGDIVAGNGTYTRKINGLLLADSVNGTYTFRFIARGLANMPEHHTIPVVVAYVEPCTIYEYQVVGLFEECFAPTTLRVWISTSEMDCVDTVQVLLIDHDSQTEMNSGQFWQTSDSVIWQYSLPPTFFRCYERTPDFHFLTFRAVTRFGMECSVTQTISYMQHLAVLSNSVLPDTAYRPVTSSDTNLIALTVDMEDCELQGATDFYGLEFESRRDPYDWGRAANFYLRNDGVEPDAVAGDNTYSSWLVILRSDSLFNNVYYFRFYAIEGFAPCIAHWDSSEYLLDSIRIIQPGAVASGVELNPVELGISVLNKPLNR